MMVTNLRVTHSLNGTAEVSNFGEEFETRDNFTMEHFSLESFTVMIHGCRKKKNVQLARRIHALICANGLESHHLLENFLVPMFVDCGDASSAQQAFKKLLLPNEFSWNSLMQAYIACWDYESALLAYRVLHQENLIMPNEFTYIAALKACVRLAGIKTGQDLHFEICKEGYEKDLYVGSTLVDLYAKCGFLEEAHDVLRELSPRDVILWTTLMAGYIEEGRGEEALNCLEEMKSDKICPDNFSFVCGLKACSSIKALDKGRQLHAELKSLDRIKDHVVASAVIDMYAKCGSVQEAREVFDQMKARDVVTWTTLIRGYTEQGFGEEALACFEQMQVDGVLPDAVILMCSLKACSYARDSDVGRAINNQIYKCGYEEEDFMGNMLVDMYASCNLLSEACTVFENLRKKDVVTWNTLLAGYAELELGNEAFGCLQTMWQERTSPDEVTFMYVLKAYDGLVSKDLGQLVYLELQRHRAVCYYVHGEIVKYGYENDELLGIALMALCMRCGLFVEAQEVFDTFPEKSAISWNALLEGFTDVGQAEDTLSLFERMSVEGVLPDAVTYLCIIKACGMLGAFDMGRLFHAKVSQREVESGMRFSSKRVIYARPGINSEVILATALIDMYGRCGSMCDAVLVFNASLTKDPVIWNALLTAYALQGDTYKVCGLFQKMTADGYEPNAVTFLAVLTVCSHAGLIEESCDYIRSMTKLYNLSPTVKHFTCLVDLLGRTGRLEEASVVMGEMRMKPDLVLWSSMLGACGKWRNVEIGKHAFEGVVRLDESYSAAFVSLTNVYMDKREVGYG